MLTILFRMLRSGGLILCRTNDRGRNAASILSLSPAGDATVVDRLAAGSEVEQLALQS